MVFSSNEDARIKRATADRTERPYKWEGNITLLLVSNFYGQSYTGVSVTRMIMLLK